MTQQHMAGGHSDTDTGPTDTGMVMLQALQFAQMTLADLDASERKGYLDAAPEIIAAAIDRATEERTARLLDTAAAVRAYAAALIEEIDAMEGESSVITDLQEGEAMRSLRRLVQ